MAIVNEYVHFGTNIFNQLDMFGYAGPMVACAGRSYLVLDTAF